MSRSSPAEAADANFVAHASWLQRRHSGMTVVDRPDLVLVDSGLPCDTFNFVCRARLDPQHARDRARWALSYFREAQRPFSWWVGPTDGPGDLRDVLSSVGLEAAESELAMVADLADLRVARSSELRIERVRSEESLRAFAAVSAANWTPPDAQVVRFYELTAAAILSSDSPFWLYLGSLGDTPVGTAEMTVAGGVVGLYNISTLAPYRRRGFGTAMTLAPLLDARGRGHDTAVLQASRDGVGIYERVGFRPFGEITEYKPR